MADTSKLRLVRCPKCENLLSELPDYSIYQCGGCGTILRAKFGKLEGNIGSGRFDEKRVAVVSDESENFSDRSENFLGKSAISGVENADKSCETTTAGYGNGLMPELGECIVKGENSRKNYVGNEKLNPKVDKQDSQTESLNGLTRSGCFSECKLNDRGMECQLWRTRRNHFEKGRFSSSYQFDEDTSRFEENSTYQNQVCRSSGAEYFDHDRDELVRKLDELKARLTRFQDVNGTTPEKTRIKPKAIEHHHVCFHNHVARPPSFERYREPFPVINGSDTTSLDHPNLVNCSNCVPSFEEPWGPQTFATHPQRVPSQHHCTSLEPDLFEPNPYTLDLNQGSCACYQCFARQYKVQPQVPPSTFCNRRFSQNSNKSLQCHNEIHTATSHGYIASKVNNPPMDSSKPKSHTRPSNMNVQVGNFSRTCPQRVNLAKEYLCHAIAGGAPFVTCHKCFKLLKLPRKVFYNKGEWKMCCGACTSLISFAILNEKLVSLDTSTRESTTDDLDSSNAFGNDRSSYLKWDDSSFCSEDYDNSVYDYQVTDREHVSSSTCHDRSNCKSEDVCDNLSFSVETTVDECFSDNVIARQGVTPTAEAHEKADFCPPPPPTSQDEFDYTAKNRAINRGEKGSLSSHLDQERIVTNKSTQRRVSLKESLAIEMDILLDDYANSEESQDSVDREDDQQKGKRGVDNFLAGIIKKSFKDMSRSNHTTGSGKRNVAVNGHMIPDRLVKKAEKFAGSICSGKYWYDNRAGFWGVMGGPCLGIIPPNIQEFNYPMPEKCAGGNTGVFVNGRELHKKDLDLLASRGLPAATDRSYIIELSRRVVDKDSGKELVNLGKLAPTVEKLRCGFGMSVPEAGA